MQHRARPENFRRPIKLRQALIDFPSNSHHTFSENTVMSAKAGIQSGQEYLLTRI